MRKQNLLLGIIQFSFLGAFSTFFNFLNLYLKSNGYTAAQCGAIQALTAIVLLGLGPCVSYLIDRHFGYKKILCMGLFVSLFTTFFIPLTSHYFFLGSIMIILHSAMIRQFPTIIDSATINLRRENSNINYGLTRGIGSIGEGLAALIMGYLIARTNFNTMFVTHASLILIALISSIYLKSVPTQSNQVQSLTLNKTLHMFKHNRLYLNFLCSVICLNIGLKVISIFSSLIVLKLGGSSENFGMIMFMCGLFEVPTFIAVAYGAKRISLKYIYLGGVVCFMLGATVICFATTIPIFMIGRILTSMAYAIYISLLVEYISKIVPAMLYTTAVSIITVCAGSIAHILSSLLGGILIDYCGPFEMFGCMVVLISLAVICFYPNFKNSDV